MRNLIRNLILFFDGYRRTDEIKFQTGWSADWRWYLLYTVDHGTHVLTGAAVVTWSRWFYDNRRRYRLAAFMNRLLRHLDDQHGENSGPVLWGTVDCSFPVRIALVAFWVVLLWSLL